jgi:MFS family permease
MESLRRNRDFTILWTGSTVSALGSRTSAFAFPLICLAITGSVMWASVAETLLLVGQAVLTLPAGVLADRLDRGAVMRMAQGGGAVVYVSLVGAALCHVLTLPHLLAAAFLTGAASGIYAPAEVSALRSVVLPEDLPQALSRNHARWHVAGLVGAPLGGALFAVAAWLPALVDSVTYGVSWVLLGRLRTNLAARGPASASPRPWRGLVEGFRHVAARPFLRVVTVWSALVNFAVSALLFAVVLRLVQSGAAPSCIGLVETAVAMAAVLGSLLAPVLLDRVPTGWLTVLTSWSFVPLTIPLMVWNTPGVAAAALCAGFLVSPAGNAGISSYRLATTPDELQGRVQSTMSFVAMCVMPLSPLLAGALLAHLGGQAAMAALMGLIAAVAMIPTASRHVRRVPRPHAWLAEATPASVSCRHTPDRPCGERAVQDRN